jgi:hypothetical protein
MNNELWQKIIDTGEWWVDPWWENRDWAGAERYPLSKLKESADILIKMFPAKWAKKHFANMGQNKVVSILIGHDAGTLSMFYFLGQAIIRLQKQSGFSNILERLRNDQNEGAYFELEIADIFAENNFTLEFPRPTPQKKTPDIIIHCCNTNVEIECKCLRSEEWEIWHSYLSQSIITETGQISHRNDFDLQIELNDRISEIFLSEEKYPGFNQALIRGISSKISEIISEKLQNKYLPVDFEVLGLMKGRALLKTAGEGSYITGAEISGIAKLRRIITNGILRGLDQLSGESPGVLCIYSDFLPTPDMARTVLDAFTIHSSTEIRKRFEVMSALLLFPMNTLFEINAPYILENKNARSLFSDLEIATVVQSFLKPIVA